MHIILFGSCELIKYIDYVNFFTLKIVNTNIDNAVSAAVTVTSGYKQLTRVSFPSENAHRAESPRGRCKYCNNIQSSIYYVTYTQ